MVSRVSHSQNSKQMRKKIIKTALLLVAMAVWSGIVRWVRYKLEMYYSKVAPNQMDDDSAYSTLQTHNSVGTIIFIVCFLVYILLALQIYFVWAEKKARTASEI